MMWIFVKNVFIFRFICALLDSVKGMNMIITSPVTTLTNFPNQSVGSMEQVVQDVAEAFEFIMRFDSTAVLTAPGKFVIL